MSKEIIMVSSEFDSSLEQKIKEYNCFGWAYLSDDGSFATLSRDTEMQNYEKLNKIQKDYERLLYKKHSLASSQNFDFRNSRYKKTLAFIKELLEKAENLLFE